MIWMENEFDLVRMDVAASHPIKSIDVRKSPANFFSSVATLEQARSACKRSKLLHFFSYDADVGLAKACAQNKCTLIIAVSDVLNLPPVEKGKKIARIRRFSILARHYFAKVKLVTLAKNEFELRSAFEMKILSEYFGII
jgi:RNase P/RNase MRP subunit p30